MPNWCYNTLTIRGNKDTVAALMERAGSGDHDYVGPFNHRDTNGEKVDWGAFTPVQMELLMKDDDLFQDKRESKTAFSFHAFVPVPREVMLSPYDPGSLEKKKAEYPEWFDRFPGLMAGYDWEHRNWGVKWGARDASISNKTEINGETEVVYTFDTAWGPPTEFMDRLAALYPNLQFHLSFTEEGVGFEGDYYWCDGLCTGMEDRECEGEEEEDEWGEEEGEE